MSLKQLKNFYNNKTIFLTGHTGFKGAWLLLMLNYLGAKTYCYSLSPIDKRGNMFNLLNLKNKCKSSSLADIRNLKKFQTAILEANPDIIFHLAAEALVLKSYQEPLNTIETNVIGTTNLYEIIRNNKTNIKTIINVTSDKCYENKEWLWPYRENDAFGGYDPYSASKGMCEILTDCYRRSYFNEMKISLTSARAGNVIGGGDFSDDRIIPDLIENIQNNQTLQIRNPNAIRPWQHVLDVLYGYLLAGINSYSDYQTHSTGYNFAPLHEKDIPVKDLIATLIHIMQEGKYQISTNNAKKHEAHFLRLDSTKARNLLQWSNLLNHKQSCIFTANWYTAYLHKENIHNITNSQLEEFFNLIP